MGRSGDLRAADQARGRSESWTRVSKPLTSGRGSRERDAMHPQPSLVLRLRADRPLSQARDPSRVQTGPEGFFVGHTEPERSLPMPAEPEHVTGAQSLVRSLEAAGFDTVFGIPG